jgi:hypothetical protein
VDTSYHHAASESPTFGLSHDPEKAALGGGIHNLPIVRYDAKAGSRTMDLMRWGLVPYWAKDIKIGFSTINAMAETVDTKTVFREAFQRRRCIVPVDNFYERMARPVCKLFRNSV